MFTIHLEVVVYFLGTIIKDMDQEEQRYVREEFSSDEELSLYDMLFSENLSKQDIQKIKKVAVDLLEKVKAKITELDHWTDKQETKATIDNLIRDTLWAELPESYDEVSISVYRQKSMSMCTHGIRMLRDSAAHRSSDRWAALHLFC